MGTKGILTGDFTQKEMEIVKTINSLSKVSKHLITFEMREVPVIRSLSFTFSNRQNGRYENYTRIISRDAIEQTELPALSIVILMLRSAPEWVWKEDPLTEPREDADGVYTL